ncbi:hypothetical protein [Bacillus marinisedimentorum]|uniref:hypothetical protein n=1 Tax=Bacillus marinisedimentorum TaxID=1821260 RepID=UPI0008732666|nr:hypothetical protein [Bacillus marinisedimentorum]
MDKQDRREITIIYNGKIHKMRLDDEQEELAASREPSSSPRIPRATKKTSARRPSRSPIPRRKPAKLIHLPHRKAGSSRSKGNGLNRWLLPLAGAIVIGTLLGIMILSLLVRNDLPVELKAAGEGGEEVQDAGAGGDVIPAYSAQVIQGGAFSTEDTAAEFEKNLHEKGYPAVVMPAGDKAFLFIGIAEGEDIQEIAETYKQTGQDVYTKAFSVDEQPVSEKKLKQYYETGLSVHEKLVSLTGSALAGNTKPGAGNDSLEKAYEEWANLEQIDKTAKAFGVKLNAAYASYNKWASAGKDRNLWDAQQALLDGLVIYKGWTAEQRL